jgi:hypothetical protein
MPGTSPAMTRNFTTRLAWQVALYVALYEEPQSLGAGRPAKRSIIHDTALSAASRPAKPWPTPGSHSMATLPPALHCRWM